MSLADLFTSHEILSRCTLWLLDEDVITKPTTNQAVGYFCDYPSLNQAAHVSLHVLLILPTLQDRITLIEKGVITNTSEIVVPEESSKSNNKCKLTFQCTCFPAEEKIIETEEESSPSIVVENVTVLSIRSIDDIPSICIKTNLTPEEQQQAVGILFHLDVFISSCSQWSCDSVVDVTPLEARESSTFSSLQTTLLRLDMVPVLVQSMLDNNNINDLSQESILYNPFTPDLLFSRRVVSSFSLDTPTISTYQVPTANLSSSIQVQIVPAFYLSIQEVVKPGYCTGATLLSLRLSHSNLHHKTIVITQVSLQTQESLLSPETDVDRNQLQMAWIRKKGTVYSSTTSTKSTFQNMSNQVKWSFLETTELSFPLLLKPHETISTILEIQAMDYMKERFFHCPLRALGYIQSPQQQQQHLNLLLLQSWTLVSWSTTLVASVSTEALRVEMRVNKSSCHTGETVYLNLTITNASPCTKNLMLFFDGNSGVKRNNEQSLVIPIVHHTESEPENMGLSFTGSIGLLPIVTNLIMGELKERSSVQVQLHFAVLRQGVWPIPRLFLIDRSNGDLYECSHALQVLCL